MPHNDDIAHHNLVSMDGLGQEAYQAGMASGPSFETRAEACSTSFWAFKYAMDVDKKSYPNTRAKALELSRTAYLFAWRVDKKPTDDTRTAASKTAEYALKYAVLLDGYPHPVTRAGVDNDPAGAKYARRYDDLVAEGPGAHWIEEPKVRDALAESVKGSECEEEITNGHADYYGGVTEPAIPGRMIPTFYSALSTLSGRLLEGMYAPPPAQPPAIVQKIPISRADLEVVAACLIGEAGGEGERGVQAVMNVISNRAGGKASEFKRVVLAPKQFSAMNSATDRRSKTTVAKIVERSKKHPLWNQALMIAHRASYQQLPDLTKGSTHYHTTAVKPSWAKDMSATGYLGPHIFYKTGSRLQ